MQINGVSVKPVNTEKNLGMTLDSKLRWKALIKLKHEELQLKFRQMYWLLGPRSELSIYCIIK